MRISFDVDDTLVCYDPAVPAEQVVPWWCRPWFTEPLRHGTRGLMKKLQSGGCDIWIYTTSYRSPSYLRNWFWSLGVRLGGVVNQHRHERTVRRSPGFYPPSKFPPAFGIDLHIDDSEGVGEEGRRFGFRVLVVSPHDAEWVDRVRETVERLSPSRVG
jgi:hypothetical protein